MKLSYRLVTAALLMVLVGVLLSTYAVAARSNAFAETQGWPTTTVHSVPTLAAVTPTMPALGAAVTPTNAAPPTAPTPTTQALGPGGLTFPLKTDTLQFGVQEHLFYTDRYTPLAKANDAGFGWIRQQIHWSDQEGPAGVYPWGELDSVVADTHAQGLKLLISITSAPSFYTANGKNGMPENPKNLGDFVAALATRYQGRVGAIQIWNEQNLAYENGGSVSVNDAGRYVELLKEAYTRIKAVDPTIIVVSGAPASTATNAPDIAVDDVSYYQAMFGYQNGIIRNYVDALGVHPGGSANPPETLWPDNPSTAEGWTTDRTFYFRRVEDIRQLMVEYGMADHQVWITEFGWATKNATPGYEFGNQVSYEQQAQYIVGAMRLAKEQYSWVGAMFLWNMNFAPLWAQQGQPLHEQASFSIVNGDYSPRPAYTAIQQYLASLR